MRPHVLVEHVASREVQEGAKILVVRDQSNVNPPEGKLLLLVRVFWTIATHPLKAQIENDPQISIDEP
jgi:hypothetical protein